MPTEETARLLALSERDPVQALEASAGQLRRIAAESGFRALYAPHLHSDAYLVILNSAQATDVLPQLIRHHLEGHNREATLVLGAGFRPCARCGMPPLRTLRLLLQRKLVANN